MRPHAHPHMRTLGKADIRRHFCDSSSRPFLRIRCNIATAPFDRNGGVGASPGAHQKAGASLTPGRSQPGGPTSAVASNAQITDQVNSDFRRAYESSIVGAADPPRLHLTWSRLGAPNNLVGPGPQYRTSTRGPGNAQRPPDVLARRFLDGRLPLWRRQISIIPPLEDRV